MARLSHFDQFGALWSVSVTLVRLGNLGPFGVDGVTGATVFGFTGSWIHGSRVYWFMGLPGDGTIRGHGSIGQSVHGLTGSPADGFTGLRIHRAAFRARRCGFASRRSGWGRDVLGFMRSP